MKKKIFLLFTCSIFGLCANFDNAKDALIKLNNKAVSSQKKIDTLENTTKEYVNEYKMLLSELNSLEASNKELSLHVNTQAKELTSLKEQLISIDQTKQNIAPLINRMINTYEELVQKDIPFLKKERLQRVKKLQNLQDTGAPLFTLYREVISAYKDEYDFSNNIETYSQNLDDKKVNFLRIGRVGLYYLSIDGQKGGYFDKSTNDFIELDKKYLPNIKQAIKIAKKQAAPNVLVLPVSPQTMEKQ